MDGDFLRGYVFRVKATDVLLAGRGWGACAIMHPNQAGSRLIYAKHMQTKTTPVHSRDAPCVRPACLRACFLRHHAPQPGRLTSDLRETHANKNNARP